MDYKIVEAVGIASKLQADIEKWYLDQHAQIEHLLKLCKEIQDTCEVINTTTDDQKVEVKVTEADIDYVDNLRKADKEQ